MISSVESEQPSGTHHRGEAAAIRANLMMRGDEISLAIEEAQKALDWLPEEDQNTRSLVHLDIGAGYPYQGKTDLALASFQKCRDLSVKASKLQTLILASYNLGSLFIAKGRLHHVYQTYEQDLSLTLMPDGRYSPSASILLLGMAEILYEWNDFWETQPVMFLQH